MNNRWGIFLWIYVRSFLQTTLFSLRFMLMPWSCPCLPIRVLSSRRGKNTRSCPSSHPLSPALLCTPYLQFYSFVLPNPQNTTRLYKHTISSGEFNHWISGHIHSSWPSRDCSCLTRYATHHSSSYSTAQDAPLTKTTSNGPSRIHCEKLSSRA